MTAGQHKKQPHPHAPGRRNGEVAKKVLTTEFCINFVNKLFYYGFMCYVVYNFTECVGILAGKTTVVDVLANWMVSVQGKAATVFAALAGGTSVWACFERKEKQRKIEYFTHRVHDLERKIDPNRSSSGLTETGETDERDL
ncbi:MAG: hypothetical protein WCF85_12750 [Rhodospirillaceae bacterium]